MAREYISFPLSLFLLLLLSHIHVFVFFSRVFHTFPHSPPPFTIRQCPALALVCVPSRPLSLCLADTRTLFFFFFCCFYSLSTTHKSHHSFFFSVRLSSLSRSFSRPSIPPQSDRSINEATPTQNAKVYARCSIMTRWASLVQMFVYVTLAVAIVAADQEACDKTKCPGPLMYYDVLGCKPVYDKEGDCCATKYDCDHLHERATDKCYVNGKEYAIGEKLKDEDANACDRGCVCRMGYDGYAAFTCAVVDCLQPPPKPGCYRRKSPLHCCPGEGQEICPEKEEDVATCVVNGKTYKDGEYFSVEDDPEMSCVCQPGYEGKNVEPFCAKPKRPYCSPDFHDTYSIRQHCAPVYYSNQSPQTDCNLSTRCQNDNDTVIHNHDDLKSAETPDEDNVCLFGDLKMHLGDELNRATDYSSVCVKCVCEVPPTPTCQRLPDEECDVTKHPPFH